MAYVCELMLMMVGDRMLSSNGPYMGVSPFKGNWTYTNGTMIDTKLEAFRQDDWPRFKILNIIRASSILLAWLLKNGLDIFDREDPQKKAEEEDPAKSVNKFI